jgi:hypothetical protein
MGKEGVKISPKKCHVLFEKHEFSSWADAIKEIYS